MDQDEVSRLRLAIARLARRMRQQGRADITPSQLSALWTIAGHGPLSLGELAALENVAPPTISRIVGSLEGEGLVERTVDPNDRRSALVEVTPRAEELLAAVRSEREAWLARRVRELDADQLGRLAAAVPALEALLDEGTEP